MGKQGISYQETQKAAANSDTLWNQENFLATVRQVKHLLYDFFYMSQVIQNELIGIVAKYTIQLCLKK